MKLNVLGRMIPVGEIGNRTFWYSFEKKLHCLMWWNDLPRFLLSFGVHVYSQNCSPCPILGFMMSYPVVFGLDTSPVGSLVLVDVFGVEFGMVFTTTTPPPPPPLDDWVLFNFPNSADVAKSFPPPKTASGQDWWLVLKMRLE